MKKGKPAAVSNPAFLWTVLTGIFLALVSAGCGEGDMPDGQAETAISAITVTPKDRKIVTESVDKDIDTESVEKIAEKRKKIIEEAVVALSETRKALRALDEEKTEEALAALEKATGKLELILARQPDLALAPTDMAVTTLDLLTTLENIMKAKDQARNALEDGDVQEARALLSKLGSEIVIQVTNIPLATYPNAIKAVTPLIDKGRLEEAKVALAAALNTLVVTEHVIPLPVLRASAMLASADELAEQENRTDDDNEKLANLIENARYQLKMAEALGYGDDSDYKGFYEQLDLIERKTEGGKSGKGFFDDIQGSIEKLKKSLYK